MRLRDFEPAAMEDLIRRCAEAHVRHIANGGDPFELGSARPLDFGHWAAHKLEQMSAFRIHHGEAVALGIALDVVYSQLAKHLTADSADRILVLLEALGFKLWAGELELRSDDGRPVMNDEDMKRLAVINVVGLTNAVLEASTHIRAFAGKGARAAIKPVFPAVTCTAQSTYLTGLTPSHHGIVGNGWYDRTLSEVQFWKQSNHLVSGTKIWETLRERDPGFTCAKVFWWYNMYSTADYSITPRPMYPADGRKIFAIYTIRRRSGGISRPTLHKLTLSLAT